jgi:hypothetical protein
MNADSILARQRDYIDQFNASVGYPVICHQFVPGMVSVTNGRISSTVVAKLEANSAVSVYCMIPFFIMLLTAFYAMTLEPFDL